MQVVIVGGGIGGVACAIALARHGHSVQVLERAAAPRVAGAGISLQPNAMQALHLMGLDVAVMRRAKTASTAALLRADGVTVTRLNFDAYPASYGYAPYTIHRSALLEELLAAARELAVDVHFGQELTSLRDHGGTIKGVGRIYQQTFIDTYSRVAFAKLYDRKNAITAADLLNDRVIPFFDEQGIPLLRVLTDRGTEYCGKRDHHEYQLYLAVENIDHSRTKAKSPQTNGIFERFHKTMLQEFYQIAFRKRLYESIEQLQDDLDQWLLKYNEERPHSGRYCYGKTPAQTFHDSKKLAEQKMLDQLVQPIA